jgi:hypothetical protein
MRRFHKRALAIILAAATFVISPVSAQAQEVLTVTEPASEITPDSACMKALEDRYAPQIYSAVDSWYAANKDVLSYLEGKTEILLFSVDIDPGAVDPLRPSYSFLFRVNWNLKELHNEAGTLLVQGRVGDFTKNGVSITADDVWAMFTNAEDSFATIYEDLRSAYKKDEKTCYPKPTTLLIKLPSQPHQISPSNKLLKDDGSGTFTRDGCRKGEDYTDGDDPIGRGIVSPIPLIETTPLNEARNKTDDTLAKEIKGFYTIALFDTSLTFSIVDHLMLGSKKDYIHGSGTILSSKLQTDDKFNSEVKRVKDEIQTQFAKQLNIGAIDITQLDIPITKLDYQGTFLTNSYLTAYIGGFQGGYLEIDDFSVELAGVASDGRVINRSLGATGKYKATLRFNYCDDYGAELKELGLFGQLGVPLNNLWVLHHERSAKSFTNVVVVEVPIEGDFTIPSDIEKVRLVPTSSSSDDLCGGEGC